MAEAAEAAGRCGTAVWFAETGGLTASGERDEPGALSAAHRSLPFGTKVRVENLRNGRSVVVRVNDRGPKNRIISVSSAAADKLGMKSKGIVKVRLTVIDRDNPADPACDAVAVSAEGTTSVDAVTEVAKSAGVEAAIEPATDTAALAYAEAGGDLPAEDAEPDVAVPEAVEAVPPDAVRDMMAERFDIAFQPESWQDVELRRAIEAILPRYFNVAPAGAAPKPEAVVEPVALTPQAPGPAPQPVEHTPPPVELAAEPVKTVQERVEPEALPIEGVPSDMIFSRRLAENWSFPGAEVAEPAIDLSPPTVVTAP